MGISMQSKPRLIIIMDPVEKINPLKDSTLAMLLAAQEYGLPILYLQQTDLFINQGKVMGEGYWLSLDLAQTPWFTLKDRERITFGYEDIILQRKDPPFDMHYIHTTYLLELAEQQGAFVCNRPQSLRDCNEKMFTTWFPELCPPTLVSSQKHHIKEFIKEQHDVIVKPLDGMGGTAIFRIEEHDPNLNVILETLTQYETTLIMVQRYIPEIKLGDKRILLIDGEPIPYLLARIPANGETRANLAVGGTGVVQPLSEHDYHICNILAPELKKRGLYFVGLDVIGHYLTEINVTSPTGIRQIDHAQQTNIGKTLIDLLITKWNTKKTT